MPNSESTIKYMKEKTYRMLLEFYPPDKEVVEYLKTLDNKQGYIKQLIRDDIKAKQREKDTN